MLTVLIFLAAFAATAAVPCNISVQLHTVGGAVAELGQFPFVASYGKKNETTGHWTHYCGASILTQNCLITAGHCCAFRITSKSRSQVLVGATKLNNGGGEILKVRREIIHEQYEDQAPRIENGYDICLLMTDKPMKLDGKTKAKVALPRVMPIWDTDEPLSAMGWGLTVPDDTASSPNELQYLNNLRVMPNFECHAWERVLCTKPHKMYSTCNGDSGGPLIFTGSKALAGLVSGGATPCGTINAPAFFTKVPFFTSWIKMKLGDDKKALKFTSVTPCTDEGDSDQGETGSNKKQKI